MLQNAYFLAKIGADTAENERNFAEILPKIGNYPTGPRLLHVESTPALLDLGSGSPLSATDILRDDNGPSAVDDLIRLRGVKA